jgi:serine/threonine protein phosphatase 1
MTYCCADIHGDYIRYTEMLNEINFSSGDTLYILGDVLDRAGNGGIDLLQDIMGRENVKLILGNHEEVALKGMIFLMGENIEIAYDIDDFPNYVQVMLDEWINLGGASAIYAFCALPRSEQNRVVWYLSKCPARVEISVNGSDFTLQHDEPYYNCAGCRYDSICVTGHTPTRFFDDCPTPDKIWRDGNHWHIDCGCGYGGQLGCVCLDTGEEFYV